MGSEYNSSPEAPLRPRARGSVERAISGVYFAGTDHGEIKEMKRKKIPYGAKLPVKLTLRERDLIRDKTFCDPDFAQFAVMDGNGIRVEMSLDDIEEIQGYVAAEANHTKNSKLQKELDRLFDKFQVFLDTYDDQDE